MPLLADDEPKAFSLLHARSTQPFLLTADHAGRLIPKSLGTLGLGPEDLTRHIAWDIGVAQVTKKLAAALRAPAILQAYSRLVIDCNRPPEVPSAFPAISEATKIPGNAGLDDAAKLARQNAIFDPYHEAITKALNRRAAQPPLYIAMHSFTPVYLGKQRPMHVAVLYHRSPRASKLLADLLRREPGLVVAENDPYQMSDESDYSVPVHAERRGLDYLEIEIRQDFIADAPGQKEWAARLARLLPEVQSQLAQSTSPA